MTSPWRHLLLTVPGWLFQRSDTIQRPGLQKPLDVAHAGVAARLQVFARQPGRAVGLVELLRAFAGGPAGRKPGRTLRILPKSTR